MTAQPTTSSEEIIQYLRDRGIVLTNDDKDFIRGKVLEIMTDSYDYGVAEEKENNKPDVDCGCGQVNCPFCGG